MDKLYISLEKQRLEDFEDKAIEEAETAFGEEDVAEKGYRVYTEDILEPKILEIDISEDGLLYISMDSKIGFISMEFPFDLDNKLEIMRQLNKQVNKIKGVLENVK